MGKTQSHVAVKGCARRNIKVNIYYVYFKFFLFTILGVKESLGHAQIGLL